MGEIDLVSKLSPEERTIQEHYLDAVSPDEGKYSSATNKLRSFLSARTEWLTAAQIQRVLLQTRMEFGKAKEVNVKEIENALTQISPLNMKLLEEKVTKHDQLAVIEEIGRFVSAETKALLHPGTTSYDVLDTARAYLYKKAWKERIGPTISESISLLCNLAERSKDILQVGRTHLQKTSPVPFGLTFSGYAARIANRAELCDLYFNVLKGKISGIVGTGASVEAVIGKERSLEFEREVLAKLGLEPDYTATQIVQKERIADVGHGLVTLMHVLGDFSNDIRLLYSSDINEVTSRDNAERLGGSSADAMKNNPINYENICGKVSVVESGMRVLYSMIESNFQRDLRNSVQNRYQPGEMMVETLESFIRLNQSLPQLSLNLDRIEQNLQDVRNNPSEAMVAILRGAQWTHTKYGPGHDFVKEIGKTVKKTGRKLLEVALEDQEFKNLYDNTFTREEKSILGGKLENYAGSSKERTEENLRYARGIAAYLGK